MNIQRQSLSFTAEDFSDVMDAIVDASFSLSQALEVVPSWRAYGYACRIPEGEEGGYRIDRTLAERPRWEYADVVGGLLSYRVEPGWNANTRGMEIYESGGFAYSTMGGVTMDVSPQWGTLCGNYPTIKGWVAVLKDVRVGGTLWDEALSVGFAPEGEPRETEEDLREYLENRGQYGIDRTEEIAALD
ncbi:MAG: hypothetical protein EOM02_07810 [Synergistales bacterium]|nr:hypothetical protein [Synergistales bacterium]